MRRTVLKLQIASHLLFIVRKRKTSGCEADIWFSWHNAYKIGEVYFIRCIFEDTKATALGTITIEEVTMQKEYRTKCKDMIMEYLQSHKEHRFSAVDIHAYLESKGQQVNPTTIYRNLEKLMLSGQ